MAEWAVSEPGVPGEVGSSYSRLVRTLGQKSGRVVVRWLLLPKLHLSFKTKPEFRNVRGSGSGWESGIGGGVQPWGGLSHPVYDTVRRLHRRRNRQTGNGLDPAQCRWPDGRNTDSNAQLLGP